MIMLEEHRPVSVENCVAWMVRLDPKLYHNWVDDQYQSMLTAPFIMRKAIRPYKFTARAGEKVIGGPYYLREKPVLLPCQ